MDVLRIDNLMKVPLRSISLHWPEPGSTVPHRYLYHVIRTSASNHRGKALTREGVVGFINQRHCEYE